MTHKQTLSITLDVSLKEEVQDILKSRGLSMSAAIRRFFQQIQQPFAPPHIQNTTTY